MGQKHTEWEAFTKIFVPMKAGATSTFSVFLPISAQFYCNDINGYLVQPDLNM